MIRLSGPGTRSKNPTKYDAFAKEHGLKRPVRHRSGGHRGKAEAKLNRRIAEYLSSKEVRARSKTPWGYVESKTAESFNKPGSMKV